MVSVPPNEVVDLAGIVKQLLVLVSETADYHQTAEPSSNIGEVFSRTAIALNTIRRRLEMANRRYIVGVVGLTNVGKSTLLNALLGSDIAPRKNGPCTAAPIEFHFGSDLEVSAYFRRTFERPTWICRSESEVHERLTALADDSGGHASREIAKVVVRAPIPLLQNGLIIADTPGFGAAQMASAAGSHEEVVREYLTREVSQVFWVVLADQGIGKREVQFHDAFFKDICDDIVVTGCEGWSELEKGRFEKRFRSVFHPRMPKFHFVSGLRGIQAREAADQGELEAAGIPILESRIRELAEFTGRLSSIQNTLHKLVEDVCYWLHEDSSSAGGKRGSLYWRPDSLARWRACYQKNKVKQRIAKMIEGLA